MSGVVERSRVIAEIEQAHVAISAAPGSSIASALDYVSAAVHGLPGAAPAWQPIETAPKMRGVLLWADTSTPDFPNWRMGSGYYHTGMNCWVWEGEQVREWAHPPTHWLPLPSAPEVKP